MTVPAASNAMDEQQPTAPEPDAAPGTIFTPHRITQAVVTCACLVCFVVFWYGGGWAGFPAQRGFQASLLQQPNWALDVLVTYLLLAVSLAVGSLVTGRWWFFGGLFAAAVGMTALSGRGGPMHYVLFEAAARGSVPHAFAQLAFEQILLFAAIALVWFWLFDRYDAAAARLKAAPAAPDAERDQHAVQSVALSVLIQSATMGAIMLLLTPTDAKKQVLVSVFIGGIVGSAVAEQFQPHGRGAAWYWAAPFLVGLAGYLLAWMNATGVTTGDPPGTFAALARPLPLDYASAGVAGAILGYWVARERPAVPLWRPAASRRADSAMNGNPPPAP